MSNEKTYDDFWLGYLQEHSQRPTRLLHYVGISAAVVSIVAAIATETWWLAVVGIAIGYLAAWTAHYTFQHNIPVMFKGPKSALWSLISALRMYTLGLSGQLGPELRRAGIETG